MPAVAGVSFATVCAGYKAWERDDLTLVEFAPGTTVAGVLTKSRCPSPEVDWCRSALPGGLARGLVVNAGNSNAFTGAAGTAASRAQVDRAAALLNCPAGQIFAASTGVIGVPLPQAVAIAGVEAAFPDIKFTWAEVSAGDGVVFVLTREDLVRAKANGVGDHR